MRTNDRLPTMGVLAAFALSAGNAAAYCRATTCDPTVEDCGVDAHRCQTVGAPMQWKDAEVELEVDEAGSVVRKISGTDTRSAVETALSIWMSADCPGGGHPSFGGAVELGANLMAGFDDTGGKNQSVVLYVDGPWPYEANAVAKTSLGFSLDSGDILDADILFNASEFALSTEPSGPDDVDLTAVLTHEMGARPRACTQRRPGSHHATRNEGVLLPQPSRRSSPTTWPASVPSTRRATGRRRRRRARIRPMRRAPRARAAAATSRWRVQARGRPCSASCSWASSDTAGGVSALGSGVAPLGERAEECDDGVDLVLGERRRVARTTVVRWHRDVHLTAKTSPARSRRGHPTCTSDGRPSCESRRTVRPRADW